MRRLRWERTSPASTGRSPRSTPEVTFLTLKKRQKECSEFLMALNQVEHLDVSPFRLLTSLNSNAAWDHEHGFLNLICCQLHAGMRKESAFSSTKREHIAFSCLSFAHAYMHENRQLYQELAKEKSPQHGMREDDVLVAMLHQMWAGCYNNALSLPEPASVSALSFQEAGDLLKAHDITERFSMQTLQLLDQSIRRFAEADFPDVSGHATPSSIVTAVAAACLVVVLELTMFILRHLSKRYYKASQEDRRALHSTESETLSQTSPQEGYPSEEKSKVAEMQERMSCIPRSGSSRRASIAELPKGPSRGAPQRSS